MTIETLVCNPDGTQEILRREVPDDYYHQSEPNDTAKEQK